MSGSEKSPGQKAKYRLLFEELLGDIEAGRYHPGDRLPSEGQLASSLGYSLGTVQRSLRELAELGIVERIHGSGTFVSKARAPEGHLLHFRFRSEGGERLLPIYFETESLNFTEAAGPWVDCLGEDANGYIEIRRKINVNREFDIFSEIYLPRARFEPLLELKPADLDGVSIRDMLLDRFGTPTVKTKQSIICGVFPPRVGQLINVPIGQFGLILTVTSETSRRSPILWQRAFVPPSDREMEFVTANRLYAAK